jgi:hypothetical protein
MRQSNLTNEPTSALDGYLGNYPPGRRLLAPERLLPMHDFLIALVFVAMVASPAIVVPSPKPVRNEDR